MTGPKPKYRDMSKMGKHTRKAAPIKSQVDTKDLKPLAKRAPIPKPKPRKAPGRGKKT